jgi:hypothetical protein
MVSEAALDTTVLQRANVLITPTRAGAALLSKRLVLLQHICRHQVCILISWRLAHEYVRQLKTIKNEFVKAFIELVTRPDGKHVILNWKTPWSGSDRGRARDCRYPAEDDHVLRTAVRGHPTTVYTEEERMLKTDACIYQEFRVHIKEP